ncbi:MAG: dTDP-4-amino-4,6-dideoxygalactose transaminase [Planctomycetes bacterium]|nr:dTDP-4-amino-4,6-dideoxygalactose transaminase [Planctomycetota bacterium]
MEIPFNKPSIVGKELEYIAQAVSLGNIGADGHFTRRCAEYLETRFHVGKALMTPSCTAALEMAAILCELQPGDEVVMPSFTFVSTANAVVRMGARPVFVDIRPDTLNLDERLIEAALSPRTRAIFPVHYAGVACEMDPILELARDRKLLVVEDAAQGVNAYYRQRPLGSLGQLATYSFHETKNFVCGEGGALCVNCPELVERAHIIRDKGTNRQKFFRGDVDKYSWVDVGGSYVPSEIVCAFLLAQLEAMDDITRRREAIFEHYDRQLRPLQQQGLLRVPYAPDHCRTNCHIYYLVLPSQELRDGLIGRLREQAIHAVFHYVPLHASPMGQKLGYREGDLPVTESLSSRLVRLPLYLELSTPRQQAVVDQVIRFLT